MDYYMGWIKGKRDVCVCGRMLAMVQKLDGNKFFVGSSLKGLTSS